jgi:hypothetical protein
MTTPRRIEAVAREKGLAELGVVVRVFVPGAEQEATPQPTRPAGERRLELLMTTDESTKTVRFLACQRTTYGTRVWQTELVAPAPQWLCEEIGNGLNMARRRKRSST